MTTTEAVFGAFRIVVIGMDDASAAQRRPLLLRFTKAAARKQLGRFNSQSQLGEQV